MSLLTNNCKLNSAIFSIDEYMQEFYNNNKFNIIFAFIGILYFVILIKMIFGFNIIMNHIQNINTRVDEKLKPVIKNYYEKHNDIQNTIYELINTIENIKVDNVKIKDFLRITNTPIYDVIFKNIDPKNIRETLNLPNNNHEKV